MSLKEKCDTGAVDNAYTYRPEVSADGETLAGRFETEGSRFSDLKEIPNLIKKLGNDITRFVDQNVTLLKVELRNEIQGYIKDGVMLGLAGVMAVMGFLLINIAVACFIAALLPFSLPVSYGLGFLAVSLIYGIAAGVVFAIAKKRISERHVVPEKTVEELKRDKQWLQKEVV